MMLLSLFEQLLEIPPEKDHQPVAAVGKKMAEKMLDTGGK
jgi:hypothetical protein